MIVPAILGVAKAMQGGVASRREAFQQLYGSEREMPAGEGEGEEEEVLLTTKNISLLLKLVSRVVAIQ